MGVLDDPQKLASFFARANAVVRPLLQSPLHSVVSGRLMLLDYTGGKTGKQYSFAVGYMRPASSRLRGRTRGQGPESAWMRW